VGLGRHIKHHKGLYFSGENMGLLSTIISFVALQQHNTSVLFLEFEELALVAAGFLGVLMYLFYVKYPYNKED
jgi:hypothetical protein